MPEQLLAAVVDALNIGNWQRGAQGAERGKVPPRPDPITRPGVKADGKTIGGNTSLSIAEMRRRMERRNGRRPRR